MTRTRDCSSCCPGAEILPAICTRSPAETPESEGTLKYMPTPWSWTNRTRHSGSLYVATAVVWTLVPRTDWLAFTSQKEVRTAPACVYNPQERTTEPAARQGVVEPSNACQIIPQRHAVSLCTKVTSSLPVGSARTHPQRAVQIFYDAFALLPDSVSQPRRERSQKIM